MSGCICSVSSMRESDSRSSIRRAMRVACVFMMARKRSRAVTSSRAGPCSVSMKPESAASGVRSSWLALATKSTRISSTRRSGVRSCSTSSMSPAVPDSGATCAANQRSTGTRCENSTRRGSPLAAAWRTASTISGMRSASDRGWPRASAGAIVRAAVLATIKRASRSSTIAASGMPATTASSNAASAGPLSVGRRRAPGGDTATPTE